MSMLEIRNISKSFGEVKAVDGVSLNITQPGITVIMGPSGCGKTTLLRLIAGLEYVDNGEIYLNGEIAGKKKWNLEPWKRQMGFVFQAPALWPHMRVEENIAFGLHGISKEASKKRLSEVMEKLQIAELADRFPDQISGGQARRVALARAIAPRPKYLLLDEPLINLDMQLKDTLLHLVKEVALQESACLIYVTHDSNEAKGLSEKIMIMDGGKIG